MKKTILFPILALATLSLSAQVTIGSLEKPRAGALLDLKDGTLDPSNIGITASKGLGLPRVKLIKQADTDISVTISDIPAGSYTGDHTGLLVYNISKEDGMCPGLHVWDGGKWQALGAKAETKPDITMTDSDGNMYDARWFFADPCDPTVGAYWTRSNLYSATKAGGGAFTTGEPRLALTLFGSNAVVVPSSGIPVGVVPDYGLNADQMISAGRNITGQSYADFAKEYGLMYTWDQAMELCPTGWHLPTDADWNALSLAHVSGTTVRSGVNMRKNWKWFYTTSGYGITTYQWGQADGAIHNPSGFDAVPSGNVNSDGLSALTFGLTSYWWSTDTSGSYHYVNYAYSSLYSTTNDKGHYFSVRCVQD